MVTQLPNEHNYSFVGLSGDTKPTLADGAKNGNTFYEMNTGKVFMFNEAAAGTTEDPFWIEQNF